jgi:hypothetical protein
MNLAITERRISSADLYHTPPDTSVAIFVLLQVIFILFGVKISLEILDVIAHGLFVYAI